LTKIDLSDDKMTPRYARDKITKRDQFTKSSLSTKSSKNSKHSKHSKNPKKGYLADNKYNLYSNYNKDTKGNNTYSTPHIEEHPRSFSEKK